MTPMAQITADADRIAAAIQMLLVQTERHPAVALAALRALGRLEGMCAEMARQLGDAA